MHGKMQIQRVRGIKKPLNFNILYTNFKCFSFFLEGRGDKETVLIVRTSLRGNSARFLPNIRIPSEDKKLLRSDRDNNQFNFIYVTYYKTKPIHCTLYTAGLTAGAELVA